MASHATLQTALLVSVVMSQGSLEADGKAQFAFPVTGVKTTEKAVLLAIDDVSLPLKQNLCYYLSKPSVRLGTVQVNDSEGHSLDPRWRRAGAEFLLRLAQ